MASPVNHRKTVCRLIRNSTTLRRIVDTVLFANYYHEAHLLPVRKKTADTFQRFSFFLLRDPPLRAKIVISNAGFRLSPVCEGTKFYPINPRICWVGGSTHSLYPPARKNIVRIMENLFTHGLLKNKKCIYEYIF